jgi:hypothetical protein
MAINIIERAVVPYNSPTNKIVNKEQYSLYAPAANVNKPGMAGFDPKHFAVRDQIVELSMAFLTSILKTVVMDDTIDVDSIKQPNTVYLNFTHEVIDRRNNEGVPQMITVTGSLLVFHTGAVITEILFADNRIWMRKLDTEVLPSQQSFVFEPMYDKYVKDEDLAIGAVGSINLKTNSVTTQALRDKSVTVDKLGDNSVTVDKLCDKSVTANKLSDKSVDESKLSVSLTNKITNLEDASFVDIDYIPLTGVLRFTSISGKTYDVNLPTALIVTGGEYDDIERDLILELANGDKIIIPLDAITSQIIEDVGRLESDVRTLTDNVDDLDIDLAFILDEVLPDKQNRLTFDVAPTAGSDNPVYSYGIFAAIDAVDVKLTNLSQKLTKVESIAKGAIAGETFQDYSDMVEYLNGADKDALEPPDHIHLLKLEIPDLWIAGVEDIYKAYTYTSEEDFLADLEEGPVWVGYYVLSQLETQKVDLSDYPTKDQVPVITTTLKENGAYTLTISMGVK